MTGRVTYTGGPVLDGAALRTGLSVTLADGCMHAITEDPPADTDRIVDLAGDVLAPGFVDLQVNGGGGVLFNDDPSVAGLRRIAAAHRALGTAALLPTLITDAPAVTLAAIAAVEDAIAEGVPGIAGLHLEGPHIAPARKGAHDGAHVRPMADSDLALLCDAARRLPRLMLTFAPEAVTLDQVKQLFEAGVLLSLGHTDADFDTARAYFDAGVRFATHLFNAMSQMRHRAPGVVGAALAHPAVASGLICDGHHVHPAAMATAWRGRAGEMFLVSDAMPSAGTDMTAFTLHGRRVLRRDGRLLLEDGTLAGADLALGRAAHLLQTLCGIDRGAALAAATTVPASLIGLPHGIETGARADLIRIALDGSVTPLFAA